MALVWIQKCSKVLLLVLIAASEVDGKTKKRRSSSMIYGWDESTFIQASMATVRQVTPEDTTCKCLNWKELYQSRWVKCGEGLEAFSDLRAAGVLAGSDSLWCEGQKFYPKRDDDFCTKVSRDSALPEPSTGFENSTWCYVEAGCKDLNGGNKVNEAVSWKLCKTGRDKLLSDLKAVDLVFKAKEQGIEPQLLAQMAYPVAREKVWSSVQHALMLRQQQGGEDPSADRPPTVVCESYTQGGLQGPCGRGETFVVDGRDVWRVGKQVCKTGTMGCTPYAS